MYINWVKIHRIHIMMDFKYLLKTFHIKAMYKKIIRIPASNINWIVQSKLLRRINWNMWTNKCKAHCSYRAPDHSARDGNRISNRLALFDKKPYSAIYYAIYKSEVRSHKTQSKILCMPVVTHSIIILSSNLYYYFNYVWCWLCLIFK